MYVGTYIVKEKVKKALLTLFIPSLLVLCIDRPRWFREIQVGTKDQMKIAHCTGIQDGVGVGRCVGK